MNIFKKKEQIPIPSNLKSTSSDETKSILDSIKEGASNWSKKANTSSTVNITDPSTPDYSQKTKRKNSWGNKLMFWKNEELMDQVTDSANNMAERAETFKYGLMILATGALLIFLST